jgi:hypothetical protein
MKIRLIIQDEARIGQKGRVYHRWFTTGKRPPGGAPTSAIPSLRICSRRVRQ